MSYIRRKDAPTSRVATIAFTEEQLQQEIDEYYTLMFGRTFEAEYLGYELK